MAHFTLEGANVTGTLSTGKPHNAVRCALGSAVFNGSLKGSSLDGAITRGSQFTGTAHGSLSGTSLNIECVLPASAPYSGSLHLNR